MSELDAPDEVRVVCSEYLEISLQCRGSRVARNEYLEISLQCRELAVSWIYWNQTS